MIKVEKRIVANVEVYKYGLFDKQRKCHGDMILNWIYWECVKRVRCW